ncbi:hypothetical protein LTR37_003189 [Vermiconidia calcicola]|uniref:Uncharacterized protein n=1 Tax=Vermiconidia calcicola TaxID=1690605 RepID=A0ACC3NQR7_9PEZI|nr:hypothetical protein LTR37_003189 [Vermiconidia calcicola]
MAVIQEIRKLDLDNVPDAFRSQIEEQSTAVQDLVAIFTAGIKRYERSMGGRSEKSWFGSVPRKVQWALSAADDLDKFRQSLSAHLDMIKIAIQTMCLCSNDGREVNASRAIVSSGNDGRRAMLPERAQDPSFAKQGCEDFHGMEHLEVTAGSGLFQGLQDAEDIAQIIYRRLLSRSGGFPMATQGRAYTLPDMAHEDSVSGHTQMRHFASSISVAGGEPDFLRDH